MTGGAGMTKRFTANSKIPLPKMPNRYREAASGCFTMAVDFQSPPASVFRPPVRAVPAEHGGVVVAELLKSADAKEAGVAAAAGLGVGGGA